jgi:hypothetical protein
LLLHPEGCCALCTTMAETTTPSEQPPALSPLLQPVDTLFQLWLQKNKEEEVFPWDEYRLHGQLQSLEAFVEDLILLANGSHYYVDRIVWMDNWRTFVSLGDIDDDVPDLGLGYEARLHCGCIPLYYPYRCHHYFLHFI